MKRRTTALGVLCLVVLAAVIGWAAGRRVTSPAEIAASTAAPTPSPILVPAERRVLSTDVVTRGTGRFGSPREVTPAAGALDGRSRVVTDLPELGAEIGEGDVLLGVSGRPLTVLKGDTPMFRDLGPGMSGADVDALEAALKRLGHRPGTTDGRYDSRTEAAVRRLYADIGSSPTVVAADRLADVLGPNAGVHADATPGPGVFVAAGEVLFTPSLPVRVAELTTGLGQPVNGPVLTITATNVAIDSSVPIEESGLIAPGMEVLVDEPDLGIDAVGSVSRVADGPGTDGVDGFHVYFEVTVDDAPANLVNASVRVTVPVESTGDAVLVVPVTALTLAADGTSQVRVDRGGLLVATEVRPGLSAQGFVEVEPVDGDLTATDLVLVGFDVPTPAAASPDVPGQSPTTAAVPTPPPSEGPSGD